MPHSYPESQPRTELDPAVHRGRFTQPHQPAHRSGLLGSSLIPVGAVLGDRYRVERLLGQGGFGRTYLAEDLQRFSESCFLKEFAPQVQGDDNLAKAQGLFEREAGVLYRLDHDQIPRFRELRQTTYNNQLYLLLVQDFVPGWTYRERLDDRQQHGKTLSEAEVALMLKQLLPVLAYLHSRGVIHRDIAPDNLIQRDRDGLPVLIDFGAVKQAAVTIINEFSHRPDQGTRLGKLGYAPPEQMQQGAVFPHSDIYALGATALTLLSGEEPHQLMDPESLDWTWGRVMHLSPDFAAVLNRMVALRPRDRYPSAKAALRDLERLEALSNHPVPSLRQDFATADPAPTALPGLPVGPPKSPLRRSPASPAQQQTIAQPMPQSSAVTSSTAQPSRGGLTWAFAGGVGLLMLGSIGFLSGLLREQQIPGQPAIDVADPAIEAPLEEPPTPQPAVLSAAEVEQLNAIDFRRQDLGIPGEFWTQFIDERFARLHPQLGGRKLTPEPADQTLRDEFAALSITWLERLARLTSEQRSRLGSYETSEFEQWVATATARGINRNQFLNRIDQAAAEQLPELTGEGDDAAVVQVKRAIASQVVATLPQPQIEPLAIDPAGNAYRRAVLQPGQISWQQIQLRQGQNLRISLEAAASVKLVIYRPGQTNPWISDLTNQYWEGSVPESGPYRIQLASNAATPTEYALNAIVE